MFYALIIAGAFFAVLSFEFLVALDKRPTKSREDLGEMVFCEAVLMIGVVLVTWGAIGQYGSPGLILFVSALAMAFVGLGIFLTVKELKEVRPAVRSLEAAEPISWQGQVMVLACLVLAIGSGYYASGQDNSEDPATNTPVVQIDPKR